MGKIHRIIFFFFCEAISHCSTERPSFPIFPPTPTKSFVLPLPAPVQDAEPVCEKQGTIYINTSTSSSLKQRAGLSTPLSFDLLPPALAGSALSAIRMPDPPHPHGSQVFPSTWDLKGTSNSSS